MLYWRDNFFRDLREAAAEASAQGWSYYAEYGVEQERGLRPRAFGALKEFVKGIQNAPLPDDASSLGCWALQKSEEVAINSFLFL